MRILRKISSVIKSIGVVLLFISLVLGCYSLANTGANWAAMKQRLEADQVPVSTLDRVRYDSAMFDAMAYAEWHKNDTDRTAAATAFFRDFARKADEYQAVREAAAFQAAVERLSSGFDTEAFMQRHERREEQLELQRIRVAQEALDALNVPQAGKKKLPASVKTPSCAEAMDKLYAEYAEAHGEAIGTKADYLETVLSMMQAQAATMPATFASGMDWNDYQATLAEVQSAEQVQEENATDHLADLLEKQAAGEPIDFAAFLKDCCHELSERYPDEPLPAEAITAGAIVSSLDTPGFDGSWGSLMANVRSAAASVVSMDVFLTDHTQSLINAADERAVIGFISIFWWLTARLWVWIVIGILCILVHVLIIKVSDRVMLNSLRAEDVEKADDMLLRVEHLSQYFRSGNYVTKAVDDVSFAIKKGEVFGLVGESGCGKTTTGRTIINLYDPTAGDVWFKGLRISSTMNGMPVYRFQKHADLKKAIADLKSRTAEQIKKEPARKTVLQAEMKAAIAELRRQYSADILNAEKHALQSHVEKSKCTERYRQKRQAELTAAYEAEIKTLSGAAAEERTRTYKTEMQVAAKDNIMARMQMIFQDPIASINPRMTVRQIIAEGLVIRGVKDKEYIDRRVNEMLNLVGLVPEHADRYPHEFSGGQRQRIGIARAIIMEPELIIADEPISALDVSIQAQVINLLNDLRSSMGLTIMFIAHNLSVVKYFSDRIGVMYFGRLVELAPSDELFAHPLHPYTKSLLSAIPYPDPHHEKTRKRIAYDPNRAHDYSVDKPVLREITPGHFISCNQAEYEAYLKELEL